MTGSLGSAAVATATATKSTAGTAAAATGATATAARTTAIAATAAAFAFGHQIHAGACGVRLALTRALCFVAKRVHAALGAQMGVCTGLEVVVVTARCTGCIEVAGWARCVVARTTVVKLTWRTWTLAIARLAVAITGRTIVAAWWTVTELGAFAITCRAIAHTVTAHMAIGAGCAAL